MNKNINRSLSHTEQKKLHGSEYVKRFEKEHGTGRIEALLPFIFLSKKHKVVDFGCGNGLLMSILAPKVHSYAGIDFSLPFIQSAKKRKKDEGHKNAHIYQEDINHFCKKHKKQFHTAFLFDITEHIYDKDLLPMLKNIHSVLTQNGILYIHTPNACFLIEAMKKKNFIFKQFPEHVAVRNGDELKTLLLKAGFSNIQIHTVPHYNILKILHALSWIPLLGKYFRARLFIAAKK